MLVTRVGDSLQEPFWPEGLGINRGFLHALDCADLARGYSASRRQCDTAQINETALQELLDRREALFACTKRVSGHNRQTELRTHINKKGEYTYNIDPSTRYANLILP